MDPLHLWADIKHVVIYFDRSKKSKLIVQYAVQLQHIYGNPEVL